MLIDKIKNHSPLFGDFVIFSVVFFMIILVIGSTIFIFSTKQIVSENKGSELTKLLEIEQLKLEIFLNSEISIAMKMADSPIIKRYFANPRDKELEKLAFEEIAAYRYAFSTNSVFWLNDIDKIFYSDEHDSFTLDPSIPENYWYNMTLRKTALYNFNINYNPNLDVTKLWINAIVFGNNHRPLGIVGTGIELSTFINMIYNNYTGKAEVYFFNEAGEITSAKNVLLVSEKKRINEELIGSQINIIVAAKNLKPGETLAMDSPLGKIAISTLPLLEWYSVAVLPYTFEDYKNAMTALFFVMLLIMALVFVVFNIFISGLLEPLRKSMEEAKVANRAKTAFLANMSHEIRTPMNSIMGFSELAMDDDINPRTKDYLEKIKENSHWLLQIINDILDISKIESGKMELEKIPFALHELFASCRTLIIPKAIEKGLQLHFYAEPSFGKMPMGDPTRLRQVLVNLLSNAIKFTNVGIVKLQASISSKDENSITVHFEIKDSGIGMTAEQIEKIFDPFTQAESGTTRKYGGTGLGLPITKNIIEMMGGHLSVESTPRVGTKFSFDLTFETMDMPEEEIIEKKAVLNEIEKPIFEGEILLCEDNAMNQHVICEHLARVGLKTVVAENGKAGVDIIRSRMLSGEKQFDLIFMDMHMPVMDGLEAAARIMKFNIDIPIVAMTANIMSDEMEIYKSSGMHDCVGKPFTSQELWHCLLKYLKPVGGGNVVQKNTQTEIESLKAGNLLKANIQMEADMLLEADREFHERLKLSFVETSQERYKEITDALKANDVKLAYRLVHTLKGNAAQIGEIGLKKAAETVERQLKDGENLVTDQQMSLLENELTASLSKLRKN